MVFGDAKYPENITNINSIPIPPLTSFIQTSYLSFPLKLFLINCTAQQTSKYNYGFKARC